MIIKKKNKIKAVSTSTKMWLILSFIYLFFPRMGQGKRVPVFFPLIGLACFTYEFQKFN